MTCRAAIVAGLVIGVLTGCGGSAVQHANEAAVVGNLQAFCEAQEIFIRTDYDNDGVKEYAQALGGENSLYGSAGELSLIDGAFANAELGAKRQMPKVSYFFKVLKSQGANAPGGKKSYLDASGNMTGGYALMAYPAQYGDRAVNTFVICKGGAIFQTDLGANTTAIAKAMTEFDPVPGTWAALK